MSTRLVDYFAVVSHDPTKERNGTSVGKIVQRFPQQEWPESPFFPGLELFCQPCGWKLSPTAGRPSFWVSVLTDINADPHYAAVLSFRLPRPRPGSPDLSQSEEESDAAETSLFATTSLVLVSRHHLPTTFRNCLQTLYAVYVSQLGVSLEEVVGTLIGGVSFPPPGSPLEKFSLGAGDRQAVTAALSGTIPATGNVVAELFARLGVFNVLCLFSAVLTDKKLVFCSDSVTRVTEACQALTALLYPLKFSNVYVPMLPGALLEYLGAPSPFIMGIHAQFKDCLDELFDVIWVELDTGMVFVPEAVVVPPLPEPYNTNLLTALNIVRDPSLYQDDLAFPNSALGSAPTSSAFSGPGLDKGLRACFVRLFAELLSGYRRCLQLVRLHPKPTLAFHKSAFLGLRHFQEEQFMRLLLDSNSFQTFVHSRGPPFRVCDLFDEVVGGTSDRLAAEAGDRGKKAENIAALAHQLALNESPSTQPFVSRIPEPSENSLNNPPAQPFPILESAKVEAIIAEKMAKRAASAFNDLPVAPRNVPEASNGTAVVASVGGPSLRRLEVLRTCLHHLFENRVAESRKMASAVVLSMKASGVRVALCQELQSNLVENKGRAVLEPPQFDLLVRILNAALQNETDLDEFGVAYSIMSLASIYCRKLCQGVHQFVYTCIQEHPVWKNTGFWEAAFYHDVHIQMKALHLPPDSQSAERDEVAAFPFGRGALVDAWDLGRRPSALAVAAEKMRLIPRFSKEKMTDLQVEEESIIFSQAIHYTNLMVYLRVPLDASRLRRVNMESLESRSVAGSHRTAEDDSLSVDGGSSLSAGESGFIETLTNDGDGNASANDLGTGSVRLIAKFLDKVCSEARLPPAQLSQLLHRIPGFVGAHIENLEQVYRESKRLPPAARPKMLMPSFLAGEEMLQGYLRVILLPDGRSGLGGSLEVSGSDWGVGASLLPAEGALFLTNYRLIFKGQPCDSLMCESVIVRSMPVMGMTKEKRLGNSALVFGDQSGLHAHLHDPLQIRSATFQLLKVAFDAEVTVEKVETFCTSLEGVRWPESVSDLFALKGDAGLNASDHSSTPNMPNKKHYALNKISKIGKRLRAGGTVSKTSSSSYTQQRAIQERVSTSRPPRPPLPAKSATLRGHSVPAVSALQRSSSQEAESDDSDGSRSATLTALHSSTQSAEAGAGERDYLKDLARLHLLSTSTRSGFRLTRCNEVYQLCPSYPAFLLVPATIGDDSLRKIAKGHRNGRFPVVCWAAEGGALLIRGAGFLAPNVKNKLKDAFSGASGLAAAEDGGVMKSSIEQERYLSALVSLSPAHSNSMGQGSQLTASLGSLLSLDSLMLAPLDTQSLSSQASATPEPGRRPASLAGGAKGGSLAVRGMRPGYQRQVLGASTLSGTLSRKRAESAAEAPTTLSRASLYVFGEKSAVKALKLDGLKCEFVPVAFPSSHDTKAALKKLLRATAPSGYAPPSMNPNPAVSFWKLVDESGWLQIISSLLRTSSAIVDLIDIQNSSVAICLEGGWDATAQLSSISQILLDPEYRTIDGIRMLIEKEWLGAGHRFSHRLNHTQETSSSGVAPTFLLFIDAVHQLCAQFPGAFEFSPFLLRFLAYHSTAAFFPTFLLDCEAQRVAAGLIGSVAERKKLQISGPFAAGADLSGTLPYRGERCSFGSVWDVVVERRRLFSSVLYSPERSRGVLRAQSSLAALRLWDYYQEDFLAVGSVYDLASAEAEWRERRSEAEDGDDLSRTATDRLPTIDPSYHPDLFTLTDNAQRLIEEIQAAEEERGEEPRPWATVLANACRQANLLQKPPKERSPPLSRFNAEYGDFVSRALHKKATVQLLLRGRLGSGGGGESGALSSGGSGRRPHSFVRSQASGPLSCSVCERLVWGVIRSSVRCRHCDFVCHRDCVEVAPSNCAHSVAAAAVPQLAIREDEEGEAESGASESPQRDIVAHEGYLHKRGALLKSWKPRWFVLDTLKHQLRYYDSADDGHCKGWVDLSEVASVTPVHVLPIGAAPNARRSDAPTAFDVRTSKRTYNFAANTSRDAAEWIEKIQACIQ